MFLNYYSNDAGLFLAVPVYVYKVLVSKEKPYNLDILGETILSVIKSLSSDHTSLIIKELGIPEQYSKLIENEKKELIDKRILKYEKEGLVIADDISTETEQEFIYILYDRVANNFIRQPILEKDFNYGYMTKGQSSSLNIEFIDVPVEKSPNSSEELEKIIRQYNRLVDIEGDEEGEEEDQIINVGNFHFKQVVDLKNPSKLYLLLQTIRSKDDEIKYISPFTKEESLYFKKYFKNNIDKDRISHKLMEIDALIFTSKDQVKDSEIDKEQYANVVDKLKHAEHFKSKDIAKMLYSVDQLLKELSNSRLNILDYGAFIIEKLDNIMKLILRQLCGHINPPLVDMKEMKLYNKLDMDLFTNKEAFQSIKNVEVNFRAGVLPVESIKIKSIASYYLIIYSSYFAIGCGFSKKIVELFYEKSYIFQTIEDIRKYRNNTKHKYDDHEFYEEKYDISELPLEKQIEILTELIENSYEIMKEFNKLIEEHRGEYNENHE